MKRKSFILSLIVSGLALAAGILLLNRGARAVNVTINVKDLPEHGLHIIGPSHPTFHGMLAALTGNEPRAAAEAVKLYSFFVKNTGHQAVVAYKIRWECRKADGTVIYKDSSVSSAWIFAGPGEDVKKNLRRADSVIGPNSTWFYSLALAPRRLGNSSHALEKREGWAAVVKNDDSQGQKPAPDRAGAVELLNAELSKYTSITIILDGVFFEDGTFAGPDAAGLFGAIKAEVDAKRDLFREVQRGKQQGKSEEEIFHAIDDTANAADVDLGLDSTPSDYYKFHKKLYARELLNQREFLGADEVISSVRKQLQRPWVEPRKRWGGSETRPE
jgi:hypothetical protein